MKNLFKIQRTKKREYAKEHRTQRRKQKTRNLRQLQQAKDYKVNELNNNLGMILDKNWMRNIENEEEKQKTNDRDFGTH